MKYLALNKYGKARLVTFALNRYADNGNLCVSIITHENGYPEPWSTLTVNLGRCLDNYTYIDTNNNGIEIVEWLCEHGIGWPTGVEKRSGFCVYPEFEFNTQKLLEYASRGKYILAKGGNADEVLC